MGLIYALKYMDNFTNKSCGESYLYYTAEAIFFQVNFILHMYSDIVISAS